MQNLINHLKGIVENSIDFGCAIVRVARDLGIEIDVEDRVGYDIFEDFPEHFSIEEFRLAIVTAIVRHFDPTNQDSDRIPALRSAYEHMSRGMLSGAEMQSYHTMMFMLHPQLAKIDDWKPESKTPAPGNIPDDQPVKLAVIGYGDPELIEVNKRPDVSNMYRD